MYIDSRGKAFAHLDRLASWQAGSKPAPVTVEWDLTNVCSLACQFCHMAHTHVAGPLAGKVARPAAYGDTGRMADPVLVERGIGEMAASGVEAIVWSGGGEPTLHPAFGSVVKHAATYGLQQGLYTLGGHLTDTLVRQIAPALSWAVVSLDAPDATAYATEKGVQPSRFSDACEGILRLVDHGAPVVGVSYLLSAHNWRRVPEMVALSRALGASYTTLRPAIQTSAACPSQCDEDRSWVTHALPLLKSLTSEPDVEVDPDRFADYRDWQGHGYSACHGITLLTMVTPDGRVWVCPNRRGVEGSDLGDLREDSFAAIWARHPGVWTDFRDCRVMCRLHLVNQTLAHVYAPRQHEAFV